VFCFATTTAHDLYFLWKENQNLILLFMFVILSLCVRPTSIFSSQLLFNRTQVTSTNHCLKSELNFPHTVFFRFVSAMPLDMLIAHHAGAESHCSSHNSIPPVHSHTATAPISFYGTDSRHHHHGVVQTAFSGISAYLKIWRDQVYARKYADMLNDLVNKVGGGWGSHLIPFSTRMRDSFQHLSTEQIARAIIDHVRSGETFAEKLVPVTKLTEAFTTFLTLAKCKSIGNQVDFASIKDPDERILQMEAVAKSIPVGSCRWIAEAFDDDFALFSLGKLPFAEKTLPPLLRAIMWAVKWSYWKHAATADRTAAQHNIPPPGGNVLPVAFGEEGMEEIYTQFEDKLLQQVQLLKHDNVANLNEAIEQKMAASYAAADKHAAELDVPTEEGATHENPTHARTQYQYFMESQKWREQSPATRREWIADMDTEFNNEFQGFYQKLRPDLTHATEPYRDKLDSKWYMLLMRDAKTPQQEVQKELIPRLHYLMLKAIPYGPLKWMLGSMPKTSKSYRNFVF
jgi:hypothetical protein